MTKWFIFIICVFNFELADSQNLLVNGGFEDENTCTEFHINCSPEGWVSTSDAYNDFFKIPGIAHDGKHCVALCAGNSKKTFHRNFIRTQLLCRLHKENKYRIEFYVKSHHPILDSIGIYFTSYDFLFEKQTPSTIKPSIYLADAFNKPIQGDTGWQKISVDYLASGDEMYLTLGNFSKRDITGPTGTPLMNDFLVFFDDISMIPDDPHEQICEDWKTTRDEIYSFDERHQFLDLYIRRHKDNPPVQQQTGKTIVHLIDTLTLPDIFFEVNKSTLNKNSYPALDSLCRILLGNVVDSMVVEGYTDSTGTAAFNKQLSADRAASVTSYINQKMAPTKKMIVTRGFGSSRPVADNGSPGGRQRNRRVEIFIYIRS